MASTRSTEWWRGSADGFGFAVMEKSLGKQDGWDMLLASGREDLQRALAVTGMRTGKELTCVEIGCGIGRLAFALADHFGFVLGMDVSEALLSRAASMNRRDSVAFELCDGTHIRP